MIYSLVPFSHFWRQFITHTPTYCYPSLLFTQTPVQDNMLYNLKEKIKSYILYTTQGRVIHSIIKTNIVFHRILF